MKLILTILCLALFFVACSSPQENKAEQDNTPATYED